MRDALVTDLRYGFRRLSKSWPLTCLIVTALAIGIGVNVTIFGFVNALVLRPLDVAEPERLVRADAGGPDLMPLLLESDYEEYRDRNQSFERLAMFHHGWMAPVGIDGQREMIAVTPVSGNYFEMLGVSAAVGRALAPSDDEPDAPLVVVLSDEGRRRYFGGQDGVAGKSISIGETPFTVVGVLPPSFKGTMYPNLPQIYSTFRAVRAIKNDPPGYLLGRLKRDVSLQEAEADLKRIASQLSAERGERKTIAVYPGTATSPQLLRLLFPLGALSMAIAAAVLWIACSNIAVLLMARTAARRREIGIRVAIGASRAQLVRQLLVECSLLASMGGLGAFLCSHATSRWLSGLYFPVPMPIAPIYELDGRVLLFTLAASLGATVAFGLGPAVHSLRTDVVTSVKQGDQASSMGASRTSWNLVVTQVAASAAVLGLAGVLARSVITAPPAGFETDGILMGVVRLSGATPRARGSFIETVLARLEEVPGLASVTAVDSIPLTNNQGPLAPVGLRPAGDDGTDPRGPGPLVYGNHVSRNHFRTLGIPLLQGRDFTKEDDLDAAPVAIVNETLAHRFWPGESPIGKSLVDESDLHIEVVGLARDSKYGSRDEEPLAFVYRPLLQDPGTTPTFLVKTTLSTEATAAAIREQVAAVDPDVVVYNLRTLEERLTPWARIALASLAGALGLLGAFLGAIGTFGVVSWSTWERRREFALRRALGASESSLVRLVTRQGMARAGIGAVLGLGGFAVVARVMRSFLIGISPFDPISAGAVAMLLLGIAALACFLPARRTVRTDPMAVLRE